MCLSVWFPQLWGFWLWTTLTLGNIANITYLLYYVYLLFRQVQMLFIWWKLRREQRAAGKCSRRSKRGGNKGGKVGVKSFFTEQ